jgi:hypothetical protein
MAATMQEYFDQPLMHCLTCGHWGRGAEHSNCSATGAAAGRACGCSDQDHWVEWSDEGFRAHYGLTTPEASC